MKKAYIIPSLISIQLGVKDKIGIDIHGSQYDTDDSEGVKGENPWGEEGENSAGSGSSSIWDNEW